MSLFRLRFMRHACAFPPCNQLTANTCIQTANPHINARPSCNKHILAVADCCMCAEQRWRYAIVHYHWAINVVPGRLFYEPGGAPVAPQTTLNYAGLCFVRDAPPLHTSQPSSQLPTADRMHHAIQARLFEFSCMETSKINNFIQERYYTISFADIKFATHPFTNLKYYSRTL